MSNNLLKLYPQFSATTTDRRQQSIAVDVERRSGKDRRLEQRKNIAPFIRNDINKIKTNFDEVYAAFKEYDKLSKSSTDSFLKITSLKNEKIKVNKELIDLALSPIPMARRLVNIDDNEKDGNELKALGLTTIALINLKEDFRDIMSIFGKTKSQAPKGYYSKYGFFVGTSLEEKLQKTKWGKPILSLDTTIGESDIGKFITNILKVEVTKKKFNKEITHLNGKTESVLRRYIHCEGRRIGKLIALTLHRIPRLSLIIAALLELPSIIKTKNKDKLKQTANSTLSVILGVGCGALCSALLAPISPALPVMGLGIGYYLGSKIAKSIGFKLNAN